MAIVQFDTEKMHEPLFSFFDRAGDWGPGCDVDAECEIVGYEFPATQDPPFDKASGNDDGLNTRGEAYGGPYIRFDIRATRELEPNINERWYVKQNRAFVVLGGLGIHVDDDGSHDSDQVIGTKVIVECGDPGKDKNPQSATFGQERYSSIRRLNPLN